MSIPPSFKFPPAGGGPTVRLVAPPPAFSNVVRIATDHEPRTSPRLGVVRDDTTRPGDGEFELLLRHLQLARHLGIAPLTVAERAMSLLDAACPGWRRERRCESPSGTERKRPHQACLLAQYQHDVLLLEHGLLEGGTNGRTA